VSFKRPIGLLTPQAVASADSEQTLAGAHRLERGATRKSVDAIAIRPLILASFRSMDSVSAEVRQQTPADVQPLEFVSKQAVTTEPSQRAKGKGDYTDWDAEPSRIQRSRSTWRPREWQWELPMAQAQAQAHPSHSARLRKATPRQTYAYPRPPWPSYIPNRRIGPQHPSGPLFLVRSTPITLVFGILVRSTPTEPLN
jgi:hypothetical protein